MSLIKKKKRVSKKNKIAWRKHVDITDVEEFLEDQRLEERLGEKTENLPDDQLFQIDTKPQSKKLSSRERKKLALKTLPKCFSLLQPLTKVPDPLIKRNRVRTKEERKHPIAKKNEAKRLALGILTAKEKNVIQNRAFDKEKKEKLKVENQRGVFSQDVWQVENSDPVKVVDPQWLTSDTLRHTRTGLGKLRKTIPKSLHKKAVLAEAVETPHPGMSYNPSLKDHQDLLKQVAETEMEKIKKEKHVERVTTKMFKRVTPQAKENSWLVEMSEGLSKEPLVNEEDGTEFKSINRPVQNKKKDQKQRRKQKEQKQLEKLRLDEKIERKKIADIYKLKKLNQIIENKEKMSEIHQKKKIEKKEIAKTQPRKLSKVKFENPDLDFSLGNEISGNLKNLKTQGNLLRDRFKSLQKRSILEPTIKAPPKKKPKYKKYERASHKMDWEIRG